MKKLLLFLALFMAVPMFVGCGDDGEEIEGTLRKSDLYGTWKQQNLTMTIDKNGTYLITGYATGNSAGTWSFDGYSRIWVQYGNDGLGYTNIIHLLDETTFSYTNQLGEHNIWTRVSNDQNQAIGIHNGYVYVDLGLSVKWATCNVGASSPEEYGDYFAWGETSTKSSYTEANSKTYGHDMESIAGDPSYDAARANWGGNWRMPTKEEMEELINRCTWTWATKNGHYGYEVTGPNKKSIFLPTAGYRNDGALNLAGEVGYYWSASPYDSQDAYFLIFNSGYHNMYWLSRDFGHSIRPVLE